jgi:hypothetical protein
MKRFAICALALLVPATMASAQEATVWIQTPSGGDYVGPIAVSDTAVIELWVDVHMPNGGNLVAMDSILVHYDHNAAPDGYPNFEVQGFVDYGPWGTFGRRDPRGLIMPELPNGDLNKYQFLGLDENQPWSPTSGLAAGVHHLDDIIIHGTSPGLDDVLFSFGAAPGGFKVYPSFYTTGHYYDITIAQGTGQNMKGTGSDIPLTVEVVVPEPASLSLLLLGGLAAFRRR